eukprot:TRINITY_DN857_c0_g1_i2.p1 TRINITY_DN857_c0_g1~~TRINITY_DN857_c0_g1_i2.p1  ORF type:complete len:252 (+),score=41.27 TRINITY_DN857_c0_g1_i2:213-968(+)
MRRSCSNIWRNSVAAGLSTKSAKRQRTSGSMQHDECGLRELCELVRGGLPEVDKLVPAMQRVKWEDLKLRKPGKGLDEVACMLFEQSEDFTLCYFFIPPGKKLPLHDHPGMEIIQKVVFGSVRVRGFDWVDTRHPNPQDLSPDHNTEGLAYEVYNQTFTQDSPVTRIHPNQGGILHEISAEGTEIAGFLDFIAPPYSPLTRDCTYYTATPVESATPTPHPLHRLTPIPGYDGVPMYAFRPPNLSWREESRW